METSPLYFELVTERAELLRFAENYLAESGNQLSVEFLEKCIVYQAYKGSKPIMGLMLNTVEMNFPLRTISYVDTLVMRQILNNENLSELDMIEVGANYILKSVGKKERIAFYRFMAAKTYLHAKQLGKTYILAGSVIKALQLLHQLLLKRVLYYGPVSATRLTDVKGNVPVLKVYITPVNGFLSRATIAMLNRYVLGAVKNRIKRKLSSERPEPVQKILPAAEEPVLEPQE